MMRNPTTYSLIAAAVAVGMASTPALAETKFAVRLSDGTVDGIKTSSVSFADASCEDECETATLSCMETGGITATMADVAAAKAAKAIVAEKNQMVLKAGGKSFSYVVYKMEYMEMTGSWWLTARDEGAGVDAIAKAIAGAKQVELLAGGEKVVLPVDKTVKGWATACK